MEPFSGLNFGLGALPLITSARTRSISLPKTLPAKRA